MSIDQGVGPVSGTSVQANVTATTIFTLSATNSSGTVTKSALVTVGAPTNNPVILSFTAAPSSLAAAGASTLTWQVSNATSLSIDHSVGTVTGTSAMVNVAATTIFTLTATNASGMATAITAVGGRPEPVVARGRALGRDDLAHVGRVVPRARDAAPHRRGYDQNIDTNEPTEGLGDNASKVQFFVDDQNVLEVDGANAEYSVFKGFATASPSGSTACGRGRSTSTRPTSSTACRP